MLQCQQPGPKDREVFARRVHLGFLELAVEVERGGGEDDAWEEEGGFSLAAEAAPARGGRRCADGCEERVDVVDNVVIGRGKGAVIGGGIMAVRRCCRC